MLLNAESSKNIDIAFFSTKEISGIQFKIFSSNKGIKHIFINKSDENIEDVNSTGIDPGDPLMFNVFNQLTEYFNNQRKTFIVPLDLQGSDFQVQVWNELLNIPYGKAISYKTLAERIGNKDSVRAVGKANGSNPVPIIVPCHRVINSNGSLGGYSAGLPVKIKLLELEGILNLNLFN
jgi:methylated-DNA-[protein]-cysteine S-methyltransferase